MIFKFEEMLYEMYGEGYEDAIDCFMEYLHRHDKENLSQDDLFIEWANYIRLSQDFNTTL